MPTLAVGPSLVLPAYDSMQAGIKRRRVRRDSVDFQEPHQGNIKVVNDFQILTRRKSRHMKTLIRLTLLGLLIPTCVGMAFADNPGHHPHYLHALSDLRHARAHLEYLAATERRDAEEEHAIRKIDEAINAIKMASIDDGKNLNDHPPIDTHLKRGGRYRKALELLDAAHRDVTKEEDDPRARGLQGRIIADIDEAHRIVEHLAGRY